MSNLGLDLDVIKGKAKDAAKERQKQQYRERFHELYENYRISHPEVTHNVAIAFVRRVMSSSNDISFNWEY